MIWPVPYREIASRRPLTPCSARSRSANETRNAPRQSKIKNQQSSFINPTCRFGQIVLVQFNSMGDPENGGRFTVKKYHSAKTVSEDTWQHSRIELLPLNANYVSIQVAPNESPEMVVVGEWVASID